MSDGWVKAAERSALGDGDVIGVIIDGREIELYQIDGEIFTPDEIYNQA